jgi:hypothetical protein
MLFHILKSSEDGEGDEADSGEDGNEQDIDALIKKVQDETKTNSPLREKKKEGSSSQLIKP